MEKDIAYKHIFHFNGINFYIYKILVLWRVYMANLTAQCF